MDSLAGRREERASQSSSMVRWRMEWPQSEMINDDKIPHRLLNAPKSILPIWWMNNKSTQEIECMVHSKWGSCRRGNFTCTRTWAQRLWWKMQEKHWLSMYSACQYTACLLWLQMYFYAILCFYLLLIMMMLCNSPIVGWIPWANFMSEILSNQKIANVPFSMEKLLFWRISLSICGWVGGLASYPFGKYSMPVGSVPL